MLSARDFLILAILSACGPSKSSGDTEASTGAQTSSETGLDPTTSTTAPTSGTTMVPDATTTSATNTVTTVDPDTETVPGTTVTTDVDTNETTADPTGDADAQTPPMGFEMVEAWLAEGHYKNWACEDAVHGPLPISPHGKNRICSNAVLSGHPPDGGEYPVGSAGVKELYDDAGQTIVGYAVYLHVESGTSGDTWYWYERVPLDSPAPHDGNGVVADGLGDGGQAMTICVGCHQAAGVDPDHPGHDFVYTQVM